MVIRSMSHILVHRRPPPARRAWGFPQGQGQAVRSGAALVIVNRDPTPYDPLAAEVVRDPIGEAVPRIARQLGTATGNR